MSFAKETEKNVNALIQGEFENAVKRYGEKYSSLHEGYAVLKEEIEEVEVQLAYIATALNRLWSGIKIDYREKVNTCLDDMAEFTFNAIEELAQVAAVLQKIEKTLEG